jgi:hypothetical protein
MEKKEDERKSYLDNGQLEEDSYYIDDIEQ